MTRRLVYIGDVHGCREELELLLELVDFDSTRDRLRFVGDLVDRGPDSAGVVRLVRGLCLAHDAVCVMGNHEEKFVRFRRSLADADGDVSRVRMDFSEHKRAIYDQFDEEDHAWLASLPTYAIDGDVLLVHAGVSRHHRTREDLERKKYRRRMLMLRRVDDDGRMLALGAPGEEQAHSWSATYDGRLGTVVYGHDPLDEPAISPHAIGIDTSCCFGGRLTALIFDDSGDRRFASVPARRAYAPRRIED